MSGEKWQAWTGVQQRTVAAHESGYFSLLHAGLEREQVRVDKVLLRDGGGKIMTSVGLAALSGVLHGVGG